MDEKQLNELFSLFAKEHQRIFAKIYPGKDAGSGLKEAALTHDFLMAMRLSKDFSEAVSYEEFPIPSNSYYGIFPPDKWEEELDSLVINQNEIYGIEAKYLGVNVVAKKAESLAWNIVRLCNIMKSPHVFPKFIWKDEEHHEHYEFDAFCKAFARYGFAICNFWSKKDNTEILKQLFIRKMNDGLEEVETECKLFENSSFPDIELDVSNCLIKEVDTAHPYLIKEGWHYYVCAYCWRIY